MIMNTFSLSSFLIFIFNIIISFFVFWKGKRKKIHIIWVFFCLSIALWGFSSYKFSIAPSEDQALFWRRIANVSVILTPAIFYFFIFTFLNLQRRFQKFILLCSFVLALFFLMLNLFFPKEVFVGGSRFVFKQFYYSDWLQYRIINYLIFYVLFYWFLLGYAFFLLIRNFVSSKGILRSQLRYFILAAIIAWNGPILMWPLEFRIDIYPYSNFLLIIYPFLFAYAILKYRLMDIGIVVTRAGVFALVYSIVLGIPIVLIYFFQNIFAQFLGVIWWIIPYLFSVILATFGPFVYLYIDRKAEEKILKEQRAYQNILRNASSGMIRIKDLNILLNLIVRVVTKTVRIKHASIYLFNKEEERFSLYATRYSKISKENEKIDFNSVLVQELKLKKKPLITEEMVLRFRDEPENNLLFELTSQLLSLNAALVIPSFVEERLTGILVLGEKVSGKIYSEDDLIVFSVLANQAALAIENAQFYQEIRRTQESLFQAEKMATIGTMADGLSHQINNRFHALSLISGDSLDIVKTFDKTRCDEETKQVFSDLQASLERIQANVLQGGEVVKGLLKYSRPGQGGFERIDFKEVLSKAIEMVGYKIKLKEIDIINSINDGCFCFANSVQLQEVFFNIIDNAYDAIKERHAFLNEEGFRGKIEVSAVNDGDSFLCIKVQDNGMGVKEEDQKKLFTPFFTTKATAKKGTGLGLYVIEKIIAAHNGKIRIESFYRQGTCFTISIPMGLTQ